MLLWKACFLEGFCQPLNASWGWKQSNNQQKPQAFFFSKAQY